MAVLIGSVKTWKVYVQPYRKQFVLIDTNTGMRWANELFKTKSEAMRFARQNGLKLVNKK